MTLIFTDLHRFLNKILLLSAKISRICVICTVRRCDSFFEGYNLN
jgi:hypothetical protein